MGMNNLILLLVQQGEAWNLKIFKYTVLKLFIENLYIYTVYFNIFTPPFLSCPLTTLGPLFVLITH